MLDERVLLVADDQHWRGDLSNLLFDEGFDVHEAPDISSALDEMRRYPADLVLLCGNPADPMLARTKAELRALAVDHEPVFIVADDVLANCRLNKKRALARIKAALAH